MGNKMDNELDNSMQTGFIQRCSGIEDRNLLN